MGRLRRPRRGGVPLDDEDADRRTTARARRRQAVIQLASTLRALGRPQAGADLLLAERGRTSDHLDDAVTAFLALTLVDLGREREAAALALGALSRHLPSYGRSLAHYTAAITDPLPNG
ncbi:tetratricopeptide repeat protein [Streptomyces edwardsiae]|uniref:Tetratricopeptide repeat protein n=1 Tax=Streptomyces edwardsiae TaxID=3075527 RepID=A0ABU2QFF2_9ACTN|nr:tetratricopeptide repeat protein [Streptomyces sp. DSM 41635]MDT0403193.1 tetratricopeptide repeat protein [Streptomyces sp. DSM 41635]